jgi:hypothetical protein
MSLFMHFFYTEAHSRCMSLEGGEMCRHETDKGKKLITAKDRSWMLFIPNDGSLPALYIRTKASPSSSEDTYIAATGVFDRHGREVPAKLIHQLGLRIIGRDYLDGITEAWEAEDPSSTTIEARDIVHKALDEHLR